MKKLFRESVILILLTSLVGLPAFAQNQEAPFNLDAMLKFNCQLEIQATLEREQKQARAMEVIQGKDCLLSESGEILLVSKSLLLDNKPLDFSEFNLLSSGKLTVTNGQISGKKIPFYVYLNRNGNNVLIPCGEEADPSQTEVEIAEILNHAKTGDFLVIEPVNKKEGTGSILKVIGPGC